MLRVLIAASIAALMASSAMARPSHSAEHRSLERAWAMDSAARPYPYGYQPYSYGYQESHYGGGFGGLPLGGGTATSPGGIP